MKSKSKTLTAGKTNVAGLHKLVEIISSIFMPIVGLMSACGLLRGILALLLQGGILTESSGAYQILFSMADAPLYFLPILVGYTTAKRIGTDTVLAAAMGGVLLYPSLCELLEGGTGLSFLSIPIAPVIYKSSVIPIVLGVVLQKYTEKLLKKIIPEVLRTVFVPLLTLFFCTLCVLAVFGPLGNLIGQWLAAGYGFLYNASPLLAGTFLGIVIQPLVIIGGHWPLLLTAMNNVSQNGFDTITVLMVPAVFAQAGAALAVFFKVKDKATKGLCLSAAVSSVFGVTESAMFGVNLPRKRPFLFMLVGAGIGGAVAGISGATAKAFSLPSAVSFPVYWGQGIGILLVACGIGFCLPLLLTLLFYRENIEKPPLAERSIQ